MTDDNSELHDQIVTIRNIAIVMANATQSTAVVFGVFMELAAFLEQHDSSLEELAAHLLTMHNDVDHMTLVPKLARMTAVGTVQ